MVCRIVRFCILANLPSSPSCGTLIIMPRWLRLIIQGVKIVSVIVCFFFFASIVQPQIAEHVIPRLIAVSQGYTLTQKGVDLDPIFFSEGGGSITKITGLYSTKHAYVGNGIFGDLVTSDTRVMAVNLFLSDYSSPMAPYAEIFVFAADQAGLDWRLVASISGVESAFGTLIPYRSYNAWGWRGGPDGAFSNFGSWSNGITVVTSSIARGYGTDTEPFSMEATYCPPCGQVPTHDWANGVARYMEELNDYRSNL
jgi:hypothetical protein